MYKKLLHIFLFLLVSLSPAFSQDEDSTEVRPDVSLSSPDNPSPGYTDTYQPLVRERRISADTLIQIKRDDAFWYVDQPPPKKEEEQKPERSFWETIFQQGWFWVLLAAIFLGLLIWYLASMDIR